MGIPEQGIHADRILEVVQTNDGERTFLIFGQQAVEAFLSVPTDALAAMMPMLATASNAAHSPGGRLSIDARDLIGEQDTSGNVLLTIVNSAGAEMVFSLSVALVNKLSAICDNAQQRQSGSSATH